MSDIHKGFKFLAYMDTYNDHIMIKFNENESDLGRSTINNGENLTFDSAYNFLASDLSNELRIIYKLLSESNQTKTAFLRSFIDQVRNKKIPLIYKAKLMTKCKYNKLFETIQDIGDILESKGGLKIAFSIESEIISIFKEIFGENLFESELFSTICEIIYRTIKETALKNWDDFRYLLFVHLFLLGNGIFLTKIRV